MRRSRPSAAPSLLLAGALALGLVCAAANAGVPDGCGDGVVDLEECDDGNLVDCDGCDSNCTFSACGNQIVCPLVVAPGDPNTPSEQCDPPNGSTCESDCKVACLPPTRDQTRCVSEVNRRALEKVGIAQAKENERCLKDHQKGRLTGALGPCLLADPKGKVLRKRSQTDTADERLCFDDPPGIVYTSAGIANDAAQAARVAVIHHVFGEPLAGDPADPNQVLVTSEQDKATARCQLEMLKRANKLAATLTKELNGAVKTSLLGCKKVAVVGCSAEELASRLDALLANPPKASKRADKLVSTTDKRCVDLPDPAARFGGFCAAPTLAEIQRCVIAATICEVCEAFEIADNLALDCDAAAAAAGGACAP